MVNSSGEIWMQHFSARSWNCSNLWNDFLGQMETLLGDRLLRLDDKDPVRRKVTSADGEGKFVVQFGAREDSRWIAGRLNKTGIQFDVTLYKAGRDSLGRRRFNSLNILIPPGFTTQSNILRLDQLFNLTNQLLETFYGFADERSVVCAKQPSGTHSVDLNRELLGVFWMTYLGPEYKAFFGTEKLMSLKNAVVGSGNGITIKLAAYPGAVPAGDRIDVERALGTCSFASMEGSHVRKEPGQYVLTQDQLSLRFGT